MSIRFSTRPPFGGLARRITACTVRVEPRKGRVENHPTKPQITNNKFQITPKSRSGNAEPDKSDYILYNYKNKYIIR
jgi:hypothetical protein